MSAPDKSLAEMVQELPPEDQKKVRKFVESLKKKTGGRPPKQKFLKQDWAGALSHLRSQYTSLELQKKALEWWIEEDVPR